MDRTGTKRDYVLRAAVLVGVAVCCITELLSPFHMLRRGPVALAWLLVLGAAAVWGRRHEVWQRLPTAEWGVVGLLGLIIGVIGLTAWMSPPNSADALAYHMPRVVYWAQAGSVAFFPTPYLNQIMLQPMAEYLMLHTYLLSGGDRFINLIAWAAFAGCIAGVSAIGDAARLSRRGQALAALFCATIPSGILQASGAKNDCLTALWIVCAVYFALRNDAAFLGLAAGLALGTKATAYLFLPPMVAMVWLGAGRRPSRKVVAWLVGGVLLINGLQYARNMRLSGSPLGYDSANADGVFRWRNDRLGWRETASNLLRHGSEQLGARSPAWNQRVYDSVVRMHERLGIDPQDPATTWPQSRYEPPQNANHEANANSKWHLLLMVVAALAAWGFRQRVWGLYAAGLLAGLMAFCFYLKWQPFMTRLELPLFVLGAPLAAWMFEGWRGSAAAQGVIAIFLLSNARLPLMQNWTRPLQGPRSLFITRRDDNYFSDMVQWNNQRSYAGAVETIAGSGCELVGVDINRNHLEYPFEVLLRERNPAVRFIHTAVGNLSARYYPSPMPRPCAIFCPDCAEDAKRLAAYRDVGPPITIDRFLVWLPARAILPAK